MTARLLASPAALFAMPKTRALLPIMVFAAALAALSFGVGTAAAKKKPTCWKVLLIDAYDGRIDKTYPVHCYHDAIKHIPEDSLIYGALKNDINRALLSAVADLRRKGVKVGPNTLLPGEEGTRTTQSHKPKGIFAAISDKIGPGNGSSIPLPLLVLAGLGLLLVAAAGASFMARWIAARRAAQPHPATSPPTPRRK
jgi:hypothetical protein